MAGVLTNIPIGMDVNKFPHQLFPCFYNTGPPSAKSLSSVGSWGLYNQAFEIKHCFTENDPGQLAAWKFDTQHRVKGEIWKAVESAPVPLMAPSKARSAASGRVQSAADVSEHMRNFYLENCEDAFSGMSAVLAEHFSFGGKSIRASAKKNVVPRISSKMDHFLSTVNYRTCPISHRGNRVEGYVKLLDDVIHDVPPALLAQLLQEDLLLQKERVQFNEVATGGALGYFPLRVSDSSQEGCLVFPEEFSLTEFHKVVLEFGRDEVPRLSVCDSQPLCMELSGAARQISVGSVQENVYVGVCSDYHCGVWRACPTKRVVPLEVIQTEQVATCVCVSPHIPGELLVATESGAAYLWTVGKGLSKFREEKENLYFNARSSWRWCEFSAHPKVLQYADRTGVELTDTRSSDMCSYTLFRIGETPHCRSGERVILSKYLQDVCSYHHLITTQHSAYVMDERFPCVPMLKWDHLMADPPLFAQVLPGSSSPPRRTNKVLLGSQRSQELMLLQYSGGGAAACCSLGPPLKLSGPADALGLLRAHVPHRQQQLQERLAEPAAGFTAIQHSQAKEGLCVLQLSVAGDIFYQTLTPQADPASADTQRPRNSTGSDEERSLTTKPSFPSALHNGGQCSEDVSVCQEAGTSCREEEVVNGDEEDMATASNAETRRVECSDPHTGFSLRPDLGKPQMASNEVVSKWDSWLKGLFESQRSTSKRKLSQWTLKTKGLISCQAPRRDPVEEDQFQRLKKDLQEAMKKKSVLVHDVTYLPHLQVAPWPDPVVPADWSDSLSQRLWASWQGHWKSWWDDKMGMNHAEKVAALRKKRRKEKQARAHRRVALSESFGSSHSYLSDLDDLSGWSSGQSIVGASSDMESSTTNLSVPNDFSEPERGKVRTQENRSDLPSLATREAVDHPSAQVKLASRKAKRPEQDYLSSLFGSQGLPETQEDSGAPLQLTPFSQGCSISASQRNPSVVLSNRGSQVSQPRKKRPRMGF